MPDGSIRISTRLDNRHIDKDVQTLENKIKKLQLDNSNLSKQQNNLQAIIDKYKELTQKTEEYKKQMQSLQYIDSKGQIQVTDKNKMLNLQAMYSVANNELQKQAPKIDNIYIKLDKVKNKQEENNAKINEYKQKIEEVKNKQNELNINTDGMGKSVTKGIKQILKYSMTLMGIQSIYGALSGAMNSWLNGNSKGAKQLKSDIDYMKNAIGRALSPLLQYIVNLLYQALGFTGALIKAFTGVDIFAGSVADYMKDTTSSASKTNKELKKQIASFDKITKLNDNNSNQSGSGGVVTPSQDLSNIMARYTEQAQKLKDIFFDIKDYAIAIGSAIAAWKIGDLLGLTLKQKIGLSLVLDGAINWFSEIKKFAEEGKITGDGALKMIARALEVGVGAGMLTGSVSLGLSIGLLLVAVGMAEGGKHTLQGLIGKRLGIEQDTSKSTTYYMLSFELELIAKITGQNSLAGLLASEIKRILLIVADYVENVPVIGKSIAKGIRGAVKASENDMTNTIKYSSQKALEDANPWVKGIAEENGRRVMQAYQDGYSSLTDETSSVISSEQIKAISDSSSRVNREAYNAGQQEGKSVNEGIGSESLVQGTERLINTGKEKLNSSTLLPEGKYLGGTIEQGYSTNDISNSTLALVIGAKNVLNNSSLFTEGQKLPETAGQGVNNGTWQVENATRELANKANSSLNSNMKGYSAGENLISGIKQGVNANKSSLFTTISKVGSSILSTFKSVLGIHSPSREMASLAKFIPLGIAEGVDSTSDKAIGSMKNLVSGMQDTVDGIDYSSIAQIPKIPRNAVKYVPKQAISTNEIQRTIVGQDSNMLNKMLSMMQSNSKGKTSLTIPFIIDGEEWFKKTIELNEAYNLATNGGGL